MAGRAVTLKRFDGAGSNNAIGTCSTDLGKRWRFLFATVAYNSSPTQTGVTLTLDSGKGSAYDCILLTGSANALNTPLFPTGELIIERDDVLTLSAPAGGSGKTSGLTMYCEEVL